jgi:hypothetical protein
MTEMLLNLLRLISAETDACIEWPYARVADDYGTIYLNGRQWRATHVSWEITNKRLVPEGIKVCHTCDNPPCINPRHLFLGTNIDNMQDAKEKGRLARGEKQGLAKLTEEAVRDIRRLPWKTRREMAEKYGVSEPNISCVRLRKTWTHIA